CAAVFGIGLLRGQPLLHMVKSAISLAVAAVPEGLPAVATTTLAVGIQNMRRRNVFVRRLDAVETLGAVQIVCLDKTGTLTANRMSVTELHCAGQPLAVHGAALDAGGGRPSVAATDTARRLLEITALCSEVSVSAGPSGPLLQGSSTEMALVQAALEQGIDVAALRRQFPVSVVAPRAETRKRMTTLHPTPAGPLLAVKGDPVEVLACCTHARGAGGRALPLDTESRDALLRANERMAGAGLRVLGVAEGRGRDPRRESGLVWLGLAGMADPVRPGAEPAIRKFHGAGIKTVMITGDQSATAYAVARQLDLGAGRDMRILEAGQLRGMAPQVLAAVAPQAQVFSRVSPANKLQIVKALQTGGTVVAMTGDGINDGPALKAAQVGIAMGESGTDVAREVADIVLASNDLDGIIEAIRLGRATYTNIRKVLRFLVGTNASETFAMLGAAVAGLPEPLTPMQLLWLNLVSDVLPGLALGLDPPERDVLSEQPHDPRAPILGLGDFRQLMREGGVMGLAGLGAFAALGAGPAARTVAFHGLTLSQLVQALACHSERRGLLDEWREPPSPLLIGALGACAALQASAQIVPPLRRILGLVPLTPGSMGAIAVTALAPVLVNEAISWLSGTYRNEPEPTQNGG
ncbi:MAG: cation-transporting P-type ATPase, partial [Rhodospirillaceae bacterium]|nr:cation-transporting P-type ATPase [Rhodospirillaceae bacterium]